MRAIEIARAQYLRGLITIGEYLAIVAAAIIADEQDMQSSVGADPFLCLADITINIKHSDGN